ncbi:MAG TPA: 30S ribosome-binding factor RbfA [Patescibacteria group bacterium]|nr:30S ribosome-binding factor RbfA [Patescibacteria group bacterium]
MRRFEQVAEVIKNELASILKEELAEHLGIVTITGVKIQNDFKAARVYVSHLGENDRELLQALERKKTFIQHALNSRLMLRYTPKISFFRDTGLENSLKVESLLQKIKKKRGGQR